MSKKSRKRRLEGKQYLSTTEWEEQHILSDEISQEIVSMWEIPQISQFLHLTKDALNLTHLSVYEIERMLLMPRASKQLANIMTALLSSPVAKTKMKKVPPMPYQFWTNILTHKIKGWFKVYDGKRRDSVKVLEILGVEPEFWKIFPNESVLDDKDFDELTFRQRVWLIKTVCDTVMHSRKSVQEELAKQPWEDQFELSLGTDRDGAKYVYFPQFIKTDLRIYRYYLDNKILSTQPVEEKVLNDCEDERKGECSGIKKRWKRRRRDSESSDGDESRETSIDCKCPDTNLNEDTNLSSTSTCSNNNHIDLEIISRKRSRSSSKISEVSTTSSSEKQRRITRSSGYDSTTSIDSANETKYSQKMFKGFLNANSGKSNIEIISGLINNLKSNIADVKVTTKNSELKSRFDTTQRIDTLPSSSKTDDEKLNEIIDAENSKLSDRQVSISKSDDEKLNETVHRVKTRSQSRKNVEEIIIENETIELDTEDSNNVKDTTLDGLRILLQKDALDSELCLSKLAETEYNLEKSEKSEIENSTPETNCFDEMLTDLSVSNFQLVADSVDSLRLLISSFSSGSDDDNIDTKTDTDDIEVLNSSEVELVEKLKELLKSVESMESSLRDSMKKARGKLQKEWSNFKDGIYGKQGPICCSSVEDQDLPSDSGLGSNWWILGSQGCPLSTSRESALQMLSQSTISTLSPRNAQRKAESSQNSESESENTKQQSSDAKESQITGTQKNEKEEGHRAKGAVMEDENTKKSQEDHQTKRVLRARGVSSYTEQFSSDDEIEEDKLDAWSDVEAIYAAPGTQTDTSSVNTGARDRYDDNPSTQEDSDQDWILPSSRKRKHKRPSATRRLKSFQQKIQNIKVGTMEKSGNTGNTTHSTVKDSNTEKSKVKDIIRRRIHRSLNRQASVSQNKPAEDITIVKNEPMEETSKEAELIVESVNSVHSELDIKEEDPFSDSALNMYDESCNSTVPQNYVMINAAPAPMNYYLVQPNPGATCVTPHGAIVQSAPFVSAVVPPIQQSYYVQDGQSYIIPNAPPTLVTSQIASFQPQGPPHMMEPQPFVTAPSYVPYMVASTTQPQIQPHFQQAYVTAPVQPPTSVRAPAPIVHEKFQQILPVSMDKGNSCLRPLGKVGDNKKDQPARVNFRNPHGAVIRSTMPIRNPGPRTTANHPVRPLAPAGPRQQQPNTQVKQTQSNDTEQKTTSLIVLSDSDDEIEMIITNNTESEKDTEKTKLSSQVTSSGEHREAPRITSDIQIPPTKNVLPPQILQRMSQGGISITPIKQSPLQRSAADCTGNYATNTNTNTQLVVVVNETGGHYALSLPNGSKLILTPEQVAQIRASNGGKLIL